MLRNNLQADQGDIGETYLACLDTETIFKLFHLFSS